MARSSVAVLSVENRSAGEERTTSSHRAPDERPSERTEVPPHARPWGFVRRTEYVEGSNPGSLAQDIGLWLDQQNCRFLIAVEKVVIDDLAPIEFAQFVRALRHSTTQILFKFEIRDDGSVGRPFNVWS